MSPRALSTARLRLVPASADTVRAELEDRSRLGRLVEAEVPPSWPPLSLAGALPTFLSLHEQHPDWIGWLGWYAIRTDTPRPVLVGSVGFNGKPDARKAVEIGYSILPEHQRQGLATEMVGALLDWAAPRGAEIVEAETTVDNVPSIRLLQRHGFKIGGADASGRVRGALSNIMS